VKIQLTKTKTIEWKAPWEKGVASIGDVVGIELCSGHPSGAPAVRLSVGKGGISVTSVGFVPEPRGQLPSNWDELGNQPKWSIPSAFRAESAALTINSVDSTTRQTAADPKLLQSAERPEGVAASKDGVRSVFRRMADESSVLTASLPEYQALWLNRLLPEGRRPTAVSVQTVKCSLLCSLAAQPGFCEQDDEAAVFVTQSEICIAGFRKGLPLLIRECPGIAGAAAMRDAIKQLLGLDESMLDTVFASNSIIDTRPALEPLLSPAITQIELSLDYLKSRLGADPKRIFLMGNVAGCAALKRVIDNQIPVPIVTPNPFDGLVLPTKSVGWKEKYCVGELPQTFLAALGAALAVLEGAK